MSDLTPFDPPLAKQRVRPVPGEIGQGVLGKFSKAIYWYLALTLCLAIAMAPAILALLFIHPSASNFALIALALAPIGPALSAGLYAVRARYREEDRGPFRAFWRGYKQNFWDVLKLWLPALLILGVIAFNLAFGGLIGLGNAYRIGLAVLAALVTVWVLHAIAIASFFNFRTSDLARLGGYYLMMAPRATFAVLALLVLIAAGTWFLTPAVVAILGGILLWFWFQNTRVMLTDVYRRRTDPAAHAAFAEQLAVEAAEGESE